MRTVQISFVGDNANTKSDFFNFSDNTFTVLEKIFEKFLPLVNPHNNFSQKSKNTDAPIIGISDAFLIKAALSKLLYIDRMQFQIEDKLQLTELLMKVDHIFHRSINSYYTPNVFTGAFTLTIDKRK